MRDLRLLIYKSLFWLYSSQLSSASLAFASSRRFLCLFGDLAASVNFSEANRLRLKIPRIDFLFSCLFLLGSTSRLPEVSRLFSCLIPDSGFLLSSSLKIFLGGDQVVRSPSSSTLIKIIIIWINKSYWNESEIM